MAGVAIKLFAYLGLHAGKLFLPSTEAADSWGTPCKSEHQSGSGINGFICITVNLTQSLPNQHPLNCTYWWDAKSSKRVPQTKPICKVVLLFETLKKLKWSEYN